MSTRKAYRALALVGMCLVFIWITAITIPFGHFVRTNWLVITTFVVNGIVWASLLIAEINKRAYSFTMIHWSFCLLFFFYAAFIQYAHNRFPWVTYRSDEVLIQTNVLLFIWTLSFMIGGKIGSQNAKRAKAEPFYLKEYIGFEKLALPMTFISIANTGYRIARNGLLNMLARSTSSLAYVSNSSLDMVVSKAFQACAYFAVVFCLLRWMKRKRGIPLLIVSTGCLLLSYFPTSTARYVAAGIYLGVLLTGSKKLKKGRMFIYLFIGAFMIILPFLNAFRNVSFKNVSIIDALSRTLENLSVAWLAGDYDAYTMFTLVIEHVKTNGTTWGNQLLGALFFFVPRTLWPSKAVGSGYFVADTLGWSFKNLSCPLAGESYINFGVFGIILFGVFLGRMLMRLDVFYWKTLDMNSKRIRRIDIIYPVSAMFFFFMCRGDLMSSFAYMVSYIAVWMML